MIRLLLSLCVPLVSGTLQLPTGKDGRHLLCWPKAVIYLSNDRADALRALCLGGAAGVSRSTAGAAQPVQVAGPVDAGLKASLR